MVTYFLYLRESTIDKFLIFPILKSIKPVKETNDYKFMWLERRMALMSKRFNPLRYYNTFSFKKLLATFVLFSMLNIVLILLPTQDVLAYNLTGLRWSGQPTSGCCATLYTYNDSNMYTSSANAWDSARNAWTNSAANLIYYTTTSSTTIYLTDEYSTQTWDALSTWYDDSTHTYYTSARGSINTRKSPNYSAAQLKAAATHELGHIAALGHYGGCVIMNADPIAMYNSCGYNTPQQDDINGINAVY